MATCMTDDAPPTAVSSMSIAPLPPSASRLGAWSSLRLALSRLNVSAWLPRAGSSNIRRAAAALTTHATMRSLRSIFCSDERKEIHRAPVRRSKRSLSACFSIDASRRCVHGRDVTSHRVVNSVSMQAIVHITRHLRRYCHSRGERRTASRHHRSRVDTPPRLAAAFNAVLLRLRQSPSPFPRCSST